MFKISPSVFPWMAAAVLAATSLSLLPACSPQDYREEADEVAYRLVADKQQVGLGKQETFTIETPADTLRRRLLFDQDLPYAGPGALGATELPKIDHWPDDDYLELNKDSSDGLMTVSKEQVLELDLRDCLIIAAASNRGYQTQKEDVYRAALTLDLAANEFRTQFASLWNGNFNSNLSSNPDRTGVDATVPISLTQRLKNGINISSALAYDVSTLLLGSSGSSQAVAFDASIEIPLARGSGSWIVTEPLTQAERNLLYAVWEFERFKESFAVDIAEDYLNVLRQLDVVENARNNYERLQLSAKRSAALGEAGRLQEIEVDQARQDELRARDQWINSQFRYAASLDAFKLRLGIPTDSRIELDQSELDTLAKQVARQVAEDTSVIDDPADELTAETPPSGESPDLLQGPTLADEGLLGVEEPKLIELALANRVDLFVTEGEVYDAMRNVIVAANNLEAEVTLLGTARTGGSRSISSASTSDNLRVLQFDEGVYNVGLNIDLPLERTRERNAYRDSLILLQRAVRAVQLAEDQIKFDIRGGLRDLRESSENLRIQAKAVTLAARRVQSTALFLEAGRAQVRDLLDAQRSLLDAQNALTSAVVRYRVAQLRLQLNAGLLEVDSRGLWQENTPNQNAIEEMLAMRAPRVILPVQENIKPLSRRTRELSGSIENAVEDAAGEGFVEPENR